MTAVRKRRIPANDQRPKGAPRISYVVMSRMAWSKKKIASIVVLGIFIFLMGAILAVIRAPTPAESADAPFDITLNSPPPKSQDDAMEDRFSPLSYKALPPVLEIEVKDGAASQAAAAQEFMSQGDMAQAMLYQRRAVELAPKNMLFRLKLAIMFDRASEREGAAMLYRQVVDAYERRDNTLPRKLDIDGIRARLAYLSPTAER